MSLATLSPPFGTPSAPIFSSHRRPAKIAAIAGAHILVVWALLQGDVITRAVHQASPLVVALLSDPAPPRPPDLPPLPVLRSQPTPPPQALMPAPEISVATAPAAPPPAAVVASISLPITPPITPPNPVPTEAAAPRATASAPAVAAAPPAPPVLPASAIRYRVPPPIEVPMASRRLGESGTVLLRVWVDAQGSPRQVSLQRSSGFARLDEQALAAMRQARFQPVLQPASEGGSAIEWIVMAPLQYEID